MSKTTKRQTFTLIELLVVIAIIAILAALLLPALQQARERGYQSTCTGNLKQIGYAMAMYQSDFKGYYPKGILSQTPAGYYYYWTWAFCDFKYLAPKVFSCPTGFKLVSTSPLYQQFANNKITDNANAWQFSIYGLNASETGGREFAYNCPWLKTNQVKDASRFIVAVEAFSSRARNKNTGTCAYPVHGGSKDCNTLRGDGHVKIARGINSIVATVQAAWYSSGGELKAINYTGTPWSSTGTPRSTEER